MNSHKNLNVLILKIFAPVLILTGILGFLIPPQYSLMSTASIYNIFHISAGIVGLVIVVSKNLTAVRTFNIVFGSIDLYQALAGLASIFPDGLIHYTLTDDLLHLLIGAALLAIGIGGKKNIEED